MTHPQWVLVDPHMQPGDIGPFLPGFLVIEDKRTAAEQINERYLYGGWRPWQGKYKITRQYHLHSPGYPVLKPRALTKLRDETIILYPHDIVAIVQKDRTFEVSRLD